MLVKVLSMSFFWFDIKREIVKSRKVGEEKDFYIDTQLQ